MLRAGIFAALLLVSGCRGPDPGQQYGLFFPRHGIGSVGPVALLEGRLAVEGQCIWIVRPDGSRVLPIWPAGFGLTVTERGTAVLDKSGQELARAGEQVRLVGGETVTDQYAFELMGQEPPPLCRARDYWATSELKRSIPSAPTASP